MWCPYSNVNLQKVPDIALSSRSNCAYLHMHQESPRRSTHRVATPPHQTVLPARQWNLRTFRGLEGHKPVLFHLVVFGDDLLQQRDCIRACSRPCGWGTFVQNTFNNPGLSKCGKTVLPFRYVDSPLSGCLGLEGYCDCGWSGFETISGWFKRGVAMREQLTDDKIRHSKYNLFHINAELATLDELSTWLTLWVIQGLQKAESRWRLRFL